ncbi:MAG: hypothetical protein AAF389_03930 [Gemmatimonadota bacterium]
MDDSWRQLNILFDRLADAPPSERAIILEAETQRSPRLRQRLECMLAAHDIGSIDVERAVRRAFAELDRPSVRDALTSEDARPN